MLHGHAAGPARPAAQTGHLPASSLAQGAHHSASGHSSDRAAPGNEVLARHLRDRHILLAEDEAMVAMDVELALRDVGSHVLGPATNLPQALKLSVVSTRIDGAILDIDLGGEDVFPVARTLVARCVPFVFHTGALRNDRLDEFLPLARVCRKPVPVEDLLGDLAELVAAGRNR